MTDTWNFPGSRWWKIDFHTHTPASNDYGNGDKASRGITPEKWLQKAMESGLDCVVVTDHNSGDWINKLKAANEKLRSNSKPHWYRDMTIFPGVEITVADSSNRIHLLAVFDPGCDDRKVTGVLGSCGITGGYGDSQDTSTNTGFIDTVQKIAAAEGIAIPAHIDGRKGLLENATSLQPELRKSLSEVFAAEFSDLKKFDNAEPTLKKAVDSLAKVTGSDAHDADNIGSSFSWIKMSRPSIVGLRLALMDHGFCVENQPENPNQLPDTFLSKLTIQNMKHCGRIKAQPLVAQLHPYFNSIIGGRGTGKSTIIESVRIVSRRDQNLDNEAPGVKRELDKFMESARGSGVMLDNTEIMLEFYRRGKNYQLRWRHDGQCAALEERTNTGWKEIEVGNLRERFQVSIFSQKQINELASNPRGLLEIIDRSPQVNRADWNSRWQSAKSQFLQLREYQRELSRQLAGEQKLRTELSDVENDLKGYEEKGHGEILKQYQKRSQQKEGLTIDHAFSKLSRGIRGLAYDAGLSDFPAHLFDEQDKTRVEMQAIHERAEQGLGKVSESLGKLADEVDRLKEQRAKDITSSKWYQVTEKSTAAYNELVKEYEEKNSQLSISLYGEWVERRNLLQHSLKKLDTVQKTIESTEKQISASLKKFQELRLELLEKRRNFLAKTVGRNKYVRMELVPYGDVSSLEDDYRSLLNLEDGKFITSVCDQENQKGILWTLGNWEDDQVSEPDLPSLISKIKDDTINIAKGQDTGNDGRFDNRLRGLFEKNPAVFDQLEAWWPEDMLRVKYSTASSSGDFNDLEKGSAGQKAAAILAFLLSYGNEPLIIDQPEDDLDSTLIYDLIVNKIHENKNRRQLIIATHNPNIVVNGDSELIHILKFEKGQVQIDQQGGLEEPIVRESICTIMEGGRQAFDKRYKRIMLDV